MVNECNKCGKEMSPTSCPDNKEGCCVLHLKCYACDNPFIDTHKRLGLGTPTLEIVLCLKHQKAHHIKETRPDCHE